MTSLHHVAEENLPLEPSYAATWYACTGCMRCRTFCDHGNEVASALYAGRAESVRARVEPAAARGVIARHAAREARAIAAAREALEGNGDAASRASRTAPVAFVPGCTGPVVAPDDARATLDAVRAIDGREVRVAAPSCCGLPLLEAGDRDGFMRAARRLLEDLRGAELAVFADPGCLHAMKRIAPSFGVAPPPGAELVHAVELAADRLARVGRLGESLVASDAPILYHDACRLGRGLGTYDPPRLVLTRLLGRAPDEMHQNRDRAECSGAGGQLPRTDPEAAAAIADERLAGAARDGRSVVVTACPAATRAFRKRGARAHDLMALVGETIAG